MLLTHNSTGHINNQNVYNLNPTPIVVYIYTQTKFHVALFPLLCPWPRALHSQSLVKLKLQFEITIYKLEFWKRDNFNYEWRKKGFLKKWSTQTYFHWTSNLFMSTRGKQSQWVEWIKKRIIDLKEAPPGIPRLYSREWSSKYRAYEDIIH